MKNELDLPARLGALRFAGPFGFANREWHAHVPRTPVVYRLLAWDLVSDRPRSIARAGGVDARGVLDIGESGDGRRRLADFLAAAEGRPRSHRAGILYHQYGLADVYPLESLRVEVLALPHREAAAALEAALLEDYAWRLKDRPPLNGSLGKAAIVTKRLARAGRSPRCADGWLDIAHLLPSVGGPDLG